MRDLNSGNFGLAIAYLLPGFVALLGVSFFSEAVRTWLSPEAAQAPTVGGFLYVTLASLAAGMAVSTVRWAVIDTIHHATGIAKPQWDFSRLRDSVAAYGVLVEIHYQYYLSYSNLVVALAFTYAGHLISRGFGSLWMLLAFFFLEAIFWMASRDALKKYYRRAELVLRKLEDA